MSSPWFGEVPPGWQASRLSRWFSVALGKMLDESRFATTEGATLPYIRAGNIRPGSLDLADVKAMPFSARDQVHFSLRAGDLLVVEGGSIGVNARINTDMPGWGYQKTVNRVRAKSDASTAFLGYQLDALRAGGAFDMIANVSTIQHLTAEKLERLVVFMPPPSSQRAIAAYLDRETAQIDAFIAKNEELITLLTERRAAAAQSEVEHHVGLGSRLKFHFREIDVRAGSKWEELPLLSVSIHHGVVPRDDDSDSSSEASDLSHYKVASSGDIVLNRMRAFQGGLGVAPCTGLVSPDYAVLRPAPDVDPNWLALVMRTPRFVSEMVLRLRGIGTTDSGAVRTPRISVADLGAILVSVPGSTVQAAELHAVATSTTQIEAALLVAKRSVELARERRAALISAAVTGRIDVADA